MNDVWEARQKPERKADDDARSPFDVDYARIIHSASFRRLQGKTQILNLGDSDFYRTRLTHSLEVAQIAGGLVRQFQTFAKDHPACPHLPPISLVQTLGFAHDLGHPPFGHGGETALNYCMRNDGGFEGNGQTLRILTKLENFSKANGANLTRRSLLGVLKYPVAYSAARSPEIVPTIQDGPSAIRIIDRHASEPPKSYLDCETQVVEWALSPLSIADRNRFQAIDKKDGKHARTRHKSLDCSIMDIADDIAYGVHDFEDAIALGLIREGDFRRAVLEPDCAVFLNYLNEKYPDKCGNDVYEHFVRSLFSDSNTRKMFINILVRFLMANVRLEDNGLFDEPLLRYRAGMTGAHHHFLKALKDIVFDKVIKSPQVQHLEFKGQNMVVAVFETFESDPKAFLPTDAYEKFAASGGDKRIICDHISGMTDGHLMKTYERLFSPRMGSVFDKL
ncbi:anti-phage deoxyguanosine triphosphatase [Asticcacaulis sp. SL142]|uniref:anti-phage deoxyguanosine triphosphatase n=1 Tax=Asticcacaulis sp. SL142 TaxID=2995155 RepID=UPI00226CBA15|nr:anti-phage deoxyguanosine triphosphatase [Asticcacaulis sp. SL142]WAC49153.1 anti-phage deoxyguanosine triphosphatase [Asticcacaulis sp. SL142]